MINTQAKPQVIGVIPARMAASRFPGKPLFSILGRPMIEHVCRRAALFPDWDELVLATCDEEIAKVGRQLGVPVTMTGDHHVRALDRVAEAATLITPALKPDDIVVCVQGDEPMMRPDMMSRVIQPLIDNPDIACTVLAMHVTSEEIWKNPDTVKIVSNDRGEVLYTTRVPVPHAKNGFGSELMARRIYGIFAWRWHRLQEFTSHPETRLEELESCDSNRILDMNFCQYIAPYPSIESFSVDSPEDIFQVEESMERSPHWGLY